MEEKTKKYCYECIHCIDENICDMNMESILGLDEDVDCDKWETAKKKKKKNISSMGDILDHKCPHCSCDREYDGGIGRR